MDTEGLINFLKERQNLHLNETHYNIFRHKEITGSDFLNYTKEEFEGFGLASGPAKRIEQLVNELNNQSKFYKIYTFTKCLLYMHIFYLHIIYLLNNNFSNFQFVDNCCKQKFFNKGNL